MAKYHINPTTGNPGLCKAEKNCPFGTAEDHFDTVQEARAVYEKFQSVFPTSGYAEREHKIPLDAETVKLINTLEKAGLKPYIVGGTVRDSLASGIEPKDVDLEVYKIDSMDELSALLKNSGYKVDEVGKQFGVIKTVLKNGMDIDLSLPRRDSLSGEGHRGFDVEVNPNLTLEEAASRRDFTINALYYDQAEGKIIDPVGGLPDWEEKTLRPVSEAFSEDPLRVLRGVQFASRFGLSPSEEYVTAGRQLKDTYKTLSTERVQEEFSKLFLKGKDISAGLSALEQTGWGDHFGLDAQWQEQHDLADIRSHMASLVADSEKRRIPKDLTQAAYLIKTLPESKQKYFAKVALIGDKKQNKALRLANAQGPASEPNAKTVKAWARGLGKSGISVAEWGALNRHFVSHERVGNIEAIARENNCFEAPNPDLVTGQAIMDLSNVKKGGPWIGKLMREAAQAQDEEVFVDKAGAQSWLEDKLKNIDLPR